MKLMANAHLRSDVGGWYVMLHYTDTVSFTSYAEYYLNTFREVFTTVVNIFPSYEERITKQITHSVQTYIQGNRSS